MAMFTERQKWSATAVSMAILLPAALILLATAGIQHAAAQENGEIIADEVAPDAPPAPAPTGPATDAAPTGPPRQNYLSWLYGALGPLYSIIFLSLSFALVAVLVMNILSPDATRSSQRN